MSTSLVPSLLLTFREALESALIVVIVASHLRRIGRQSLNKYLVEGVIGAIVISVALGIAVRLAFGGLVGVSEQLFEGFASLTAVAVLTYMIFWMTRHSTTMKAELEQKVEAAISRKQVFGIATLSFVAVLREGLETVLFLSALATVDAVGTFVGVVLAAATVIFLAVVLMKGIYRLNVKRFFQATSLILIVFAAGLVGSGVHELIEASQNSGVNVGVLGESAFNINPPLNTDGTYPPLHENGIIGSIFATLIGYSGSPEWLRIISYLGYWLILGAYILWAYRRK